MKDDAAGEETAANKQKLYDLIDRIEVGMLTTHDGDNLRSRPMYVTPDPDGDSLWIFVHAEEHVVSEVSPAAPVNLAFSDRGNERYVSVSGIADIVSDTAQIETLWTPAVAAWYPQGRSDPNILLLRVRVTQGETWDAEARSMRRLWRLTRARLTDETPDITENRKVTVDRRVNIDERTG